MVTIAEFRLPAGAVALESTFDRVPSLSVEVECTVASAEYGLWCSGAKRSEIEPALAADPTIESWSSLGSGEDRRLYTVTFADDAEEAFRRIADCATLTAASAVTNTWQFEVRFQDRDDVSHVYDRLAELGPTPEIAHLSGANELHSPGPRLTAQQYETLVLAIEQGYFKIPREATMQDLAEQLDVSHQALSERLRRAFRTLATTELSVEVDGEPEQRAVP